MKTILAILVLAAGCQAAAADGPKSAQAQKDQCDANLSHKTDAQNLRDGDRCFAYLRGVQEEMDGELTWADDRAHTKLVVGNWQDGVTTDQLVLVFVKYVNENPAELNKPAAAVFRRSAEAAGLYLYTPVTIGNTAPK